MELPRAINADILPMCRTDYPRDERRRRPASLDVSALLEKTRWGLLQVTVISLCMAVIFVDGVDRTGLGLVVKNLMASLHANATSLGIVFSMDNLGAVAGALVCGRLSDRLGSKNVVLITLAVIAVSTLATPHAGSVSALAITRFIGGLGLGGAIPASIILACDFVRPALRGTVCALVFSGYTIGAACGGLWSAYLLTHFSWQSLFYVGAILPAAVLGAIFLLVPEPLQRLIELNRMLDAMKVARRLCRDLRGIEFTLVGAERSTEKVARSLRALFLNGYALPTVLLWGMYILMFSTVRFAVSWLPTILTDHGISPPQAAVAQGLFNVGSLIGEISALRLISAQGANGAMLPGLILAGLCFCALSFNLSALYWAISVIALAGLGMGAAVSGIIASAATIYPATLRGAGIGGGIAAARFGQVVSPLLIGWLMDTTAGSQPVLFVVAAFPLTAAAIILPFKTAIRRQRARSETAINDHRPKPPVRGKFFPGAN